MKFSVIGLGSMGKRRIRCLKALGYNNIIGFDPREDRCLEVEEKYGIKTIRDYNNIDYSATDALIISTPPDKHIDYLKKAIEFKIPAFIEASVLIDGLIDINVQSKEKNVFLAPSCTLHFHPLIKDIREIVLSQKYGKVTNFTYHSGQYLPDWHPWENVREFYVSKRNTGGGREIVPFELSWLTKIVGLPTDIKGYFRKTIDFGVEIEDTYSFVMKFDNALGAMIVDVASRFATRSLIINMENGQIVWRWEDGMFKVYEAEKKRWINYYQAEGESEAGYNKNIVEEMYIDEIKAFIVGIDNPNMFPNTLDEDIKMLNLLYKIENSDGGF